MIFPLRGREVDDWEKVLLEIEWSLIYSQFYDPPRKFRLWL